MPVVHAVTAGHRFSVLAVFAGVSCFLALIQIFCIGFGLAGIILSHSVALIVLIASLVVSWLFASRFTEPFTKVDSYDLPGGWIKQSIALAFRALCMAVIFWAGWIWLELWILASLRPPYDWDGLYYHIPAIHEWVLAGRISWIGGVHDVPYVNYPMGVETCSFFMHHVFRTSRLVDACNLFYWPLGFMALVVIAGRLGARGIWRWLAGALIIGSPAFVSQSVSSYIDPGFASAVMASVAASCVFVFHDGRSVWWKMILLGLNIGLMAGSKSTGAPFAAIFLAASLVGLLWAHGFKMWRKWLSYIAVCTLIVFLVGSYWYTRNTIKTGNPLYPIQLKFGQVVLIDGYDYVGLNEANLPSWLEKYPSWSRMFVSWLQLDAPISGYAPVGGMGYIWLAGEVPAFIYAWVLFFRRRFGHPIRELAFLSILLFVLLLVQPSQWWARFTLWLHALGLPCFAVVLHHSVARWHLIKRHLMTIILGLGVISVAIWESHKALEIEWRTGRNPEAQRDEEMFLTSQEYYFWEMENVPRFDEFFSARRVARSHASYYGALFIGVLAMPLDQREVIVLPMELESEDVASLQSGGTEWVIWDVIGAGDVPEVLTRAAREVHVYHPSPDTHFRIIRI
ncbi:MAG: hypothetical protein GTO42_02670 [Candidatus Latescibacteria bacterium]|nr:hypothetical protein [Candidatus Latescibacterota bacterium]NIO01041.1 hypothetical protein [Candidatus Latescibacterota bacterium]NIO27440.1 hypothetical protein [Candidatus Latescibacterota bacterium]NIO54962.1 hypothetical protein [Candidatus Latescibacterota bacterium]NIT01051.1 hypothetical protein [Candidatus Latescibacterota bacterium]